MNLPSETDPAMATEPPPEETALGAVPAGTQPTVDWVALSTTGEAGPPSRVTLALLWLAAGLLLVVVAWLRLRTLDGADAAGTGSAVGYLIGTFLGAIALAVVIRWIVVRMRRRGQVLRSVWVPITVIVIAALNVVSAIGAAGTVTGSTPPGDPASAMRVAPPYTLTALDATTMDQVVAAMEAEGVDGRADGRNILGVDGSMSRIIAIDGAMRADDDLREVADGMEETSGLPVTIEMIAGTEVALALGPGNSIATWIEAPLLVTVVAADQATLRDVVEAVLTAG